MYCTPYLQVSFVRSVAEPEIFKEPKRLLVCKNKSVYLKATVFIYDIKKLFLCTLPTSLDGHPGSLGSGSERFKCVTGFIPELNSAML